MRTCFKSLLFVFTLLPLGAQESKPSDAVNKDEHLDGFLKLLDTPIEVAGAGRGQVQLQVPSSVTVLDRDTLLRFNVRTVDEALDVLVPGVQMVDAKRNITTIRGVLQENYATKVLILVDGIPTWMASTGEGAPYRIDLETVERIEVLRGPASVIYGTNAYAGAVNIVLRRPQTTRTEIKAGWADKGGNTEGVFSGGSFGEVKFHAAAYHTLDEGRQYTFVGEPPTSTATRGTPVVVREFEKSENVNASIALAGHELLVNMFRFDELYFGSQPRYESGAGGNHLSEGQLMSYRYTKDSPNSWRFQGGVNFDWNRRDFCTRPNDTQRLKVEGSRTSANIRVSHKLGSYLDLDWGGDIDQRRSIDYYSYSTSNNAVVNNARNANNLQDRKLQERSLYSQCQVTLNTWSAIIGLRHTHNELFGNNLSKRLAIVYSITSNQSIKFIAGEAFRAPTMFELYFKTTAQDGTLGSTTLKPEKTHSYELVYNLNHIKYSNLFFQATLYRANYDQKIYRVPRPISGYLCSNQNPFMASGVELEGRYSLPIGLRVIATADRVIGDEGSGRTEFLPVPSPNYSLGIQQDIGTGGISLVGRHRGGSEGSQAPISAATHIDFGFNFKHWVGFVHFAHALTLKDATNKETSFAEYNRQILNETPTGLGRRISYSLRIEF